MPADPTKSLVYAVADLGIKLAAAIAVAAIGYVGWQLQKTNADQSERRRDQELTETTNRFEEQKYLPLFDGLTAIEMTLDDAIAANSNDPVIAEELAETLLWRNMSLYIPDGDNSIKVNFPRPWKMNYFTHFAPNSPYGYAAIPIRSAVSVTAVLHRIVATCHRHRSEDPLSLSNYLSLDDGVVQLTGATAEPSPPPVDPDGNQHHFPFTRFNVDAETFDAFESWITIDALPLFLEGQEEAASRQLLLALRTEIAKVQRDLLMRHPAIAEKYLAIRKDIIVNKTYRRLSRIQPSRVDGQGPTTQQSPSGS